MASTGGMEEFIESPMLLLQCGVALAVPAVLTAIVNLGCGKKRDQPVRPGGAAKGGLSKAKPGAASSKSAKSGKSKRSTKSAASTKSGKKAKAVGGSSIKDGKSKRSSKSIDKSSKSGKKSKKSSKGSKSSKSSKKSKRDLKQQKTGPPSDAAAAKQPPSTQTALVIDADKRSAVLAEKRAAAAMGLDASAKSAATQMSSSQRSSQRPASSAAVLDANANVIGKTTLVSLNAGEATRELKMEPAELRWASAGGMQKISLLNQSSERQAVKVKCSDNNVYRVNPVYAIVEPGQTLNVDVMRQNGSNKVDKIVFVTTRAGIEENPKNLFKPGTQSSMIVLPLLAATTAAAEFNQPALTAAN